MALTMLPFVSGAQEKAAKPGRPLLNERDQAMSVRQSNSNGSQQALEWNWSPDHREFNIKAVVVSPIALEGMSGSVEIN